MPLDSAESISAAFAELAIGQDVLGKVKALPPKETRKLVDYSPVLGLDPSGNLHKQLALIDQIEADIAD